MNTCYDDIYSRIKDPIKWFDEMAVPRYCDFHPAKLANIHANQVVLFLLACQYCEAKFNVAYSTNRYNEYPIADLVVNSSIKEINNSFYTPDPPNTNCCDTGLSMTTDVLDILEIWKMTDEWKKVDWQPELSS